MSFKLPKEICLDQMHSSVLKFIIHHIHCSKSQTDEKNRKSVKFPATAYLICQGAGTAAVSYKFASQSEHPLYRHSGMSA